MVDVIEVYVSSAVIESVYELVSQSVNHYAFRRQPVLTQHYLRVTCTQDSSHLITSSPDVFPHHNLQPHLLTGTVHTQCVCQCLLYCNKWYPSHVY